MPVRSTIKIDGISADAHIPKKLEKKLKKSVAQRKFRDRLFRFIFGNPEHKDWILLLYNAICGTHYTDIKDIDLRTLQDIIYVGMKNDVSFIIDSQFIFIEQQSTFCPNMPARFFIYMGLAYQQIIQGKGNLIYSQRLIKLPTPKCICFYNGAKDVEDTKILKLSDAYEASSAQAESSSMPEYMRTPDLEVKVTMININRGHNSELLDACKPLKEYAWFCDTVRKYQTEWKILNKRGKSLETITDFSEEDKNLFDKAIDTALAKMPKSFMIRKYLIDNKAEVKNMCLTEFNEAEVFQALADDYIAEGEARVLAGLVDDGILTVKQAAQRVNMTVTAFKKKMAELKKETVKA